ncbi:hypothetical protein HMPREF3213_02382 [Heyndrickxia coagulans]|uniref:Uncharacterized protein n=1 Tax=Heyndrickxia coagulans TaxID=1398 RepID=A0A133KKI0_HEYCO|nr:hypothetical protein HMPREF3213_02382 [Heyndrickxia coagulans]
MNLPKGQNKLYPGSKCPFEPAKRSRDWVQNGLFVKQHHKKFPLP